MQEPNLERYRISALSKGLRVLRFVAEQDRAVSLTELSELSGIPSATLFRVLCTLELDGYLRRDANGMYLPSLSNLELGFATLRSSGLVALATSLVRDLSMKLGQTVNLGVLQRDRALYLARHQNTDLVTAHLQVGSTLPAVTTSIGKVLLAYLPEQELREIIDENSFSEVGPNAKSDVDDLLPELQQIRQQGWGSQNEEVARGLRSVSAPVFDESGRAVAALNVAVSAMTFSYEEMLEAYRDEIIAAATRLSSLLGYSRSA